LATHIASQLDGEVINTDSLLFYRGMDVGTAKPDAESLGRVPHHLIDILDPPERLGLAGFIEIAQTVISDVQGRGKLPILVGGTGQYVWGLLEGWDVPRVEPDNTLRAELEREAELDGHAAVFSRLEAIDPKAAARIDSRNVRRVIRAIEVANAIGPGAGRKSSPDSGYEAIIVGLTLDRPALYERIDQRIAQMVDLGWEAEVRGLLDAGADPAWTSFAAIGYREMAASIRGEMHIEDVIATARRATRRLVRHQYAWFKLDDPRIHWIQATNPGPVATDLIHESTKKSS
jgi:tRNA dimethylallyltransferase